MSYGGDSMAISRNWLRRSSQRRAGAAAKRKKIVTQRTQTVELLRLVVRPVFAGHSGLPRVDACQGFHASEGTGATQCDADLRIISSMFWAGSFTISAAILRHFSIETSTFASGASCTALWAASKSRYNAVIGFGGVMAPSPRANGGRKLSRGDADIA